MSSSFKVITPPTIEPISLTDAKAFLRVDFSDEDTVIQGIVTRARAYAETITHRALATQTIQHEYMIDRPTGGELSGPIDGRIDWYHYSEQLGANPFGAAQYYFDLAMPPLQSSLGVISETKTTVFDSWQTFTGNTYIDDINEPARMYFQAPPTANVWRFTYTCGYSTSYPMPPDLLQPLYELIAYYYEYREAPSVPKAILDKLLAKRVDWI